MITTGRLNAVDGMTIIFFTLIARLLLPAAAEEVNLGAGFVWFTLLLSLSTALLAGLGVIFLQNKCGGEDLLHTSQILLGKPGFYLVGLFYATVFLVNSGLLMRQFADNSALLGLSEIHLPTITILYTITIGICLYFGIEAITKTSFILFHFIIFWLFFIFIIVIPYYNVYNLLPWQGMGLKTGFQHGLENAGFNIGIFSIVILAPFFKNFKSRTSSMFWGYLLTMITKVSFMLVFLLTLGVEAAKEKINPFFEISSMAYFDRYFERLESFSILLLVFIALASISMNAYLALYLLARMLKLPTEKPLIPTWCLIIYAISLLPETSITTIAFDGFLIKFFSAGGIFFIPILLAIAFFLKRKTLLANAASKGGS
jgi:hypothetical protein